MLRYRVLPASFLVFLLTACGGKNTTPPTTSPPTTSVPTTPAAVVFTSTPNTQAAEGSLYSYQLAATGTGVTFSLTNAPAGATLTGSTVSWTPTAQQSRSTPNNFTVTANAPGTPSATQSWAVTPSGTIRISHVDTLWNEVGSTSKPFDWSPISSFVAALVPQADGSFQSLSGTAGANGAFEIPNVPAGYYWLRLGPRDTYWTSSSSFDVGNDTFVPVTPGLATTPSTTTFNFSFTSLDPTPVSGLLQIDALEAGMPPYSSSTNAGSTTFTGQVPIYGNLDYAGIKTLFVRQYNPTSFGSVNGYVMGPELTLSDQSLTNGGLNTISGSLNSAVPASINLSLQGSAWTPLFAHIAPTAPTATGGGFFLSVQPYVAADGPNVSSLNPAMPIDLIRTKANTATVFSSGSCSASVYPSLTIDVEAGPQSYNDPFPAPWRRTFRVCQSASITVPLPGGSTQTFNLTNTQTTTVPTATVKPLISSVQNPRINGADLFTASTVNSKAVTLSWDPPAIGTPFGYNVSIVSPTTVAGSSQVIYITSATLGTAKTSMTIPSDLLRSGQTYFFAITSLIDGNANMETKPHRSLLPIGSADLISAPITTQ